jgi:hypothetical protein
MALAKLFEDGHAVEFRKHQIEKDDADAGAPGGGEPGNTVSGLENLVTGGTKGFSHADTDGLLIFND